MVTIKTLAIIQARVSSSRLPGKVLKNVLDKPLIQLMIERINQCQNIDKIVLATSTEKSDDLLEDLCKKLKISCYRGNLDDVLDRFYKAATLFSPQYVVRLTGDCPLIDPTIVDDIIEYFHEENFDYVSNTIRPSFPDGLDCEIMTFSSLESAWKEAIHPYEREHVTPYIWKSTDLFRIDNYLNNHDLSQHRWTVDEKEDLDFVREVYHKLYKENPLFRTKDILELIDKNPNIILINHGIVRNEGFMKSMQETNIKKYNIGKCLEYQKRAQVTIPGGCQLLSKRPDMFTLGVWPGYFKKAKGSYITDLDGNTYLDMSIGGIGANVLGYCDPDVNEAVINVVHNGNSSSLNSPEEVELAELLCTLHPWAEKVRFTKCGGESMSVAVRIARAFTGRDKVIFCGYHGYSDWYLAANLEDSKALDHHLIAGLSPRGIPRSLKGTAIAFNFNNIKSLKDAIGRANNDLAAIVLEPIRNERPSKEFLQALLEVKNETGAVLIADEISSGFRLNCGGAHLSLGFEPDISVFSKALGNGYPIGAIIGRSEVMNSAQDTFLSSTYWTDRIGFAAGIAVIKKFKKFNVEKHLNHLGKNIQTGWDKIARKHSINISIGGIYPLSHFHFEYDQSSKMKAYFIQEMQKRGFLASTICYIMYSHTEKNVLDYLEAMDEVFKELKLKIANNSIDVSLDGAPSQGGFQRLN